MAKKCVITGKKTRSANNVSHANNKTKRKQKPNIKMKRIFVPSLGKYVRLKVSTKAIKTISKVGIDKLLKKKNISLSQITAN